MDPGQVENGSNPANGMIVRYRLLKAERIKQLSLLVIEPPHHRPPSQRIASQRANHSTRKPSTTFATKSATSGHEGGGSVVAKDLNRSRATVVCSAHTVRCSVRRSKTPRPRIQRYTKTGVFVCVRTLVVTLPSTTAASPPRPCDPMTMRSQPLSEAAAIMA